MSIMTCWMKCSPTPSWRKKLAELVRVARQDLRGKSVCVTGEMRAVLNGRPLARKEVRALVEEHGMIWKSGVSRKLDFLVARDVRSKSGKGKLARDYGIPIVAE